MISYNEYLKEIPHQTEELVEEIFENERDRIRIKKRNVAVKNLTRIFDAVLKISKRKGFDSVSLRNLHKEVGITMGGLYNYFKNKDDLIDMIENQSIRITKKIVENIDTASLPVWQTLEDVICCYLYASEANRKWFYFLYMETKNFSHVQKHKAVELELFLENKLTEVLTRGVKQGLFQIENTRITASMVNSLLMDWFLKRHKYLKQGVTVEEYAKYVLKALRRLLMKND